MSVIRARELTRHYGRRVGIEAVDLDVESGQLFGFLGPNGAGKTTTIRLLLGLLRPGSGTAEVFDADCWRRSPWIKSRLGYLPGDLRLYPWLSGNRAIRLLERIRKVPLRDEAVALAERFQLDLRLTVRRMSKGMRQKLGLLMAMAHRPPLLILDEPTTGLDPLMRDALMQYLREFVRDGNTVFFSSHTLSEVEQLCDRVAIVRRGQIVAQESVDSLRARAKRQVRIWFPTPLAASQTAPPDFLEDVRIDGDLWQAELSTTAPPLMRWAASQDLVDLEIGRPNLEVLFRAFYEREGASS